MHPCCSYGFKPQCDQFHCGVTFKPQAVRFHPVVWHWITDIPWAPSRDVLRWEQAAPMDSINSITFGHFNQCLKMLKPLQLCLSKWKSSVTDLWSLFSASAVITTWRWRQEVYTAKLSKAFRWLRQWRQFLQLLQKDSRSRRADRWGRRSLTISIL